MKPLKESIHPLTHGVIGQSFASKSQLDGKRDDYSMRVVTTEAQAEGAIEGNFTDYELATVFQTDFKYSRFDMAMRSLNGSAVSALSASTETDEAGDDVEV